MVKSENNNQPICKVTLFGTKRWLLNGKLHRENGPAIEYADGTKYWYVYDKLHRLDGPAVEWADGSRAWYLQGERHREDGPAIERANGYKEWYYHEKYINCSSQEEFKRLLKLQALW